MLFLLFSIDYNQYWNVMSDSSGSSIIEDLEHLQPPKRAKRYKVGLYKDYENTHRNSIRDFRTLAKWDLFTKQPSHISGKEIKCIFFRI